MHQLARTSTLALAVAISLAGCPSDPVVPSTVPVGDVPGYLTPAVCATYAMCNPLVGAIYGTPADCAAQLGARLEDSELGALEDAIAEGTIAYHGDRVDDCVAAIEALGCELANPLDVCEGIFEGLVPDGGACERSEECSDASYCAITTGCPGTCQARVASGGSCTDSAACVAGLSCTGGTCSAPAGAGAACNGTTGVSCTNLGLTCVGDDGGTAGVCTTWTSLLAGALGEVCDPQMEDFCDADLSCGFDGLDGTTPRFRCIARVAAGAACTIAVPDMCPDGQFCEGVSITSFDTEGTCAPLPTAGAPCTPAIPFPRCAGGLVCIGVSATSPGTCEPLSRLGASCASDQTCASGYCSGGTCVDGVPAVCRTP